ncbi:MAG: hypothetical protein GX287_03910 [Fusobacteria bacterium]|jgi:biotin carboxyl carrier protein|nr:hypothetical protein [Fusobacteriota bacterium]
MDVTEIKKLMQILNDTDVTEITLESEGTKVLLKKDMLKASLPKIVEETSISEDVEETVISQTGTLISMSVGKFYYKKNTNTPIIKLGDKIEKGQIIGYIESIGIKTDVISDKAGIVKEIYLENGGNAEFGQNLVLLEVNN